jgi:UPF0716 protein FxsA
LLLLQTFIHYSADLQNNNEIYNMPLLLIFLILPLAEFLFFVLISSRIGFLSAFCLCVLAAILGLALLSGRGLPSVFDLQRAVSRHELPLGAIFDGFCRIVAGLLLLVPGFLTDILALLLLLPQIRTILRHFFRGRPDWNTTDPRAPYDPDIIEGEFERIDPDKKSLDRDKSG